jgi:hypothetical protein
VIDSVRHGSSSHLKKNKKKFVIDSVRHGSSSDLKKKQKKVYD